MPWTLHATIEEFTADGYTHIECHCPRCVEIPSAGFLPVLECLAVGGPVLECPTA
jgi:hypothetical protein